MDSAAVLLVAPKFPHNVGAALRACACFQAEALRWTGDRVTDPNAVARHSRRVGQGRVKRLTRLPREERIKAYQQVDWRHTDGGIESWGARGYTPVAVEVRDQAERLVDFAHPAKALYVFGPEDGSLDRGWLEVCHRFVRIPTVGCLNLAAAVNIVLYDRALKRDLAESAEPASNRRP